MLDQDKIAGKAGGVYFAEEIPGQGEESGKKCNVFRIWW